MIFVEFPGPIQKENLELDIANLEELKEILNQDESLKEWLKICAVLVNDEIITDPKTKFNNGDRVVILAPVCGG
nr:MoaD/ThiS family protein [Campylobacter sp.]